MGTPLTGNSVGTSYQGLMKTTDNAALNTTLKNIEDGLGNASPLSMATNYVQLQAPTIELVESTGGSNLIQITSTNTYFEGAVDFTNATVTGIGGGAPGLVSGTQPSSIVSAASLTTTPATSDAQAGIAIGNNARTTGGGGFDRTNIAIGSGLASSERSISIGHSNNATGARGIAISESALASNLRSIAIGQSAQGTGFNCAVVGAYSRAQAEGAFAFGGPIAIATALNSGAIGRESTSNLTAAVAIGFQVTSVWANGTTVNQLAIQNYAAINYVDDSTAAANGVPLGGVYHTDGAMKIRIV